MLCILAIHVFFIIPGKLIIFSTEIYLNKRSLKKKKMITVFHLLLPCNFDTYPWPRCNKTALSRDIKRTLFHKHVGEELVYSTLSSHPRHH